MDSSLPKIQKSFTIILLLIFLQISLISTMVVFPFKISSVNRNGNITKNDKEYNSTHFFNDYYDQPLYTTLEIGNPSQKVKAILTYQDCGFKIGKAKHCIDDEEYLSYYNKNESSDYKKTDYCQIPIQEFDNGNSANETLYAYNDINLKNYKKFNDIGFYLGTDTKDQLCAVIGFKMDNYEYFCQKINNIVRSFKSANIVNNYQMMIKYNSDNEGIFIIGGDVKDYYSNFKEDNYFTLNSMLIGTTYPWAFNFSEVIVDGNKINQDVQMAEIENDFSLMQGSETYRKYVFDKFFDDYIQKGICSKNYNATGTYNGYYIVECDKEKNFGSNDIKNFPKLSLIVKEFNNSIFSFSYKELFTETKYKYFFNVVFPKYSNEIWILGKIFLKKYTFVLNLDQKTISFYNIIEEKEEKSSVFSTVLIVSLIVILVVVVGVVMYFVGKYVNKTRKKKANELTDDLYDYEPQNNSNGKTEKNLSNELVA